jgi:hypothetical protein
MQSHFLRVMGTLILLGSLAGTKSLAQAEQTIQLRIPPEGAKALGAIVGVWQSDTTNGVSALSNCVWTPERGAVLCEQTIQSQTGEARALNLFTFDATSRRYVLYVVSHLGDPVEPVSLAIEGALWIYGGKGGDTDGTIHRTVNDFSSTGVYYWRQESSKNGKDWTVGAHGQSKRLK